MRRLIVGLTLLVALGAAPGALGKTATARGGGVTATLSYTVPRDVPPMAGTLTITRRGQQRYRRQVIAGPCGHTCSVLLGVSSATPVHVLDLDGTGTPAVVLDLYTGGAHCCIVEQVLTSSGSSWTAHAHDFGDGGAKIVRRDGRYLFVGGDDAFAYRFTDYAYSGLPIEITTFGDGRFAEVTDRYRSLVSADADRWLRLYRKQARARPAWSDSVGLIAAWAADEYRLGRIGPTNRYLDAQARAGHLNSVAFPKRTGAQFVAQLKPFLRSRGYGR